MKLTEITFDIPLSGYQIPKFRGAMVATLGREQDRFHNHKGEQHYHYRYPMIQYRQKSGRASLVMIGEREHHAMDVGNIINCAGKPIRIGQKEHKLELYELKTSDFTPKITEKPHSYQLHHWIALNKKNFAAWQEITGLTKKIRLLEKILPNHIMKFAGGVGWYPKEQLEVEITFLGAYKFMELHRVKHLALDISFEVNAELPYQIGLGKGVTYGFGILKRNRGDR